jgi:hypothetical protein
MGGYAAREPKGRVSQGVRRVEGRGSGAGRAIVGEGSGLSYPRSGLLSVAGPGVSLGGIVSGEFSLRSEGITDHADHHLYRATSGLR